MARLHTGRHKVLAAYRSYHGATAGSIALTGEPRRWPSEPGMPGVVRYWGPYLYRSSFHAATEAEECERALAHLREVLMFEGAHTVAAIMLETGGRHERHPRAARRLPRRRARDLRRARHRDDRRRGDGRLRPVRRVVRGRPVGRDARPHHVREGRELRLRAARRRDHLAARSPATFARQPFPGGLTYSGHPLACASAVASIEIFDDEGILEHARRIGDDVDRSAAARPRDAPSVGRRGARARRVLGGRAGPQSRRRASRSCRSTRRAPTRAPMAEFAARVARQRRVAVHALQPRCTSCRRAT